MFEPDHSGQRWWDHRFGGVHLFATGIIACVVLGIVSATFLPPGAWTLASTLPSLAVGFAVFTAAIFVSDVLYHAVERSGRR